MEFVRFRHEGLEDSMRMITQRGCRPLWRTGCALLFALETADSLEQACRFPGWKLHPIRGDLKRFWSLTVTGNWRLVFRYDEETNTASDIDLIDYH